MTPLAEAVEKAKADFVQQKDRLVYGLSTTADDRINWSPAGNGRTPIQIAAHAAYSVMHVHHMLNGEKFAIPTTEEAEAHFREWEGQFTTREQVLELLEKNGSAYLEWLDALTQEQYEAMAPLPYKLGFAPVSVGLTFQGSHLSWHAAQIDYVQTCYGDLDWHIGM